MKFRNGLIIAASALAMISSGAALADGEKIYKKCKACHALEDGKNKVGPHLHGLFGRKAGSVEGYKYSDAMVGSGIVWDETTLDQYLADPKGTVPGTKMAFPGLDKEEDRKELIEYLKEKTM